MRKLAPECGARARALAPQIVLYCTRLRPPQERTGLAEPELASLPLGSDWATAELRRDASTRQVMVAGHGTHRRARASLQSDCRDDADAGRPLSCAAKARKQAFSTAAGPPCSLATARRDLARPLQHEPLRIIEI